MTNEICRFEQIVSCSNWLFNYPMTGGHLSGSCGIDSDSGVNLVNGRRHY